MIDELNNNTSPLQSDVNKMKLRMERNKEYNEFKLMQEDKFKNRFKEKKEFSSPLINRENIKYPMSGDHTVNIIRPQVDTSLNVNNIASTENQFIAFRNEIKDQLRELRDKLDRITFDQKNVQNNPHRDLVYSENIINNEYHQAEKLLPPKVVKPDVAMSMSDRSTFGVSDLKQSLKEPNEQSLMNQINYIKEAESHLSKLENEYVNVKNKPINLNTIVSRRSHVTGKDLSSPGSENNLFLNKDEENSVKQRIKESYRKDLEKQIAEKKEKAISEKNGIADSFIDKFSSQKPTIIDSPKAPIKKTVESTLYETQADSEYFYYAEKDIMNSAVGDTGLRAKPELPSPGIPLNGNLVRPQQNGLLLANDKKSAYANDLRLQMEEAKLRKAEQKRKEAEYDKKKEKEIAEFDPFHQDAQFRKAKVKDTQINLLAEKPKEVSKPSTLSNQLEGSHARGGHGIFGSPLTEKQKDSLDKYKRELSEQIEEKKRRAEEEKRLEKQRDKEEMEKVMKQQALIREEYEREMREKKANLEAQRKKNTVPERTIPTKVEKEKAKVSPPEERRKSTPQLLIGPPVDVKPERPFRKSEPRPNNILTKLDSLKTKLETEKFRVEKLISDKHEEVQIFDTRDFLERKRPKPYVSPEKKAEEVTNNVMRNRPRPMHVERRASKKSEQLDEMDTLRMLHLQKTSEKNSTLEKKQKAFLSQQGQYLQQLRDQLHAYHLRQNSPIMRNNSNARNLEHGAQEPMPMVSESNFINLHDITISPVRTRRRQPAADTKSEISLDLDNLISKNEDRLRRLKLRNQFDVEEIDPSSVLDWPDVEGLQTVDGPSLPETLNFSELEADDWMLSK